MYLLLYTKHVLILLEWICFSCMGYGEVDVWLRSDQYQFTLVTEHEKCLGSENRSCLNIKIHLKLS